MRRSELAMSLGAAVLVARCARASAQDATKNVGAGTPIEGDSLMFLALSDGYFARAGVDVEMRAFNSGEAIAAAIVGGDVALGSMNTVSLANAHLNGVPIKIIGMRRALRQLGSGFADHGRADFVV